MLSQFAIPSLGSLTSILNAFYISALAEVIGYHFLEFPITVSGAILTLGGKSECKLYDYHLETWEKNIYCVAGRTLPLATMMSMEATSPIICFAPQFEEIVDNGNATHKIHTLAGNVTMSLYENHTDSEPWAAGRTGSSQLFEWTASEEPYPAILYAVDHVLLPRKYKDFPGY